MYHLASRVLLSRNSTLTQHNSDFVEWTITLIKADVQYLGSSGHCADWTLGFRELINTGKDTNPWSWRPIKSVRPSKLHTPWALQMWHLTGSNLHSELLGQNIMDWQRLNVFCQFNFCLSFILRNVLYLVDDNILFFLKIMIMHFFKLPYGSHPIMY